MSLLTVKGLSILAIIAVGLGPKFILIGAGLAMMALLALWT